MFADGQVYESEEYVLKLEKLGNDFRAIIFRKESGELRFVEMFVNIPDRNLIKKMIKRMNFVLVNKTIILK